MSNKRNSQPVVQAVESTQFADLVQPTTVQPTFAVPTSLVEANASVAAAPLPKLSELDKMALDLAKEKRKTVLAEARTAIANNDAAELGFKNVILQLYMKYSLTAADAIAEDGSILINGAVEQPKQS